MKKELVSKQNLKNTSDKNELTKKIRKKEETNI
jgi:hypothetical protein